MTHATSKLERAAFGLAVAFALAASPGIAEAQFPQIGVELGVGVPADGTNSDLYTPGFAGAVDGELGLHPAIGLRVGVAAWLFGANASPEWTHWIGGRAGVRFHWSALAGLGGDGWIDAHASFGVSNEIWRPGFDVGAGYDFDVLSELRLGPYVRYQMGSDPQDAHAHLVAVGLSIGLLTRPSPSGEPDADADGIVDALDECPTSPAGARPDPERPGCAERDQDGDGTADREDHCPDVAAGADPHPDRPGCPAGDRDGDGVSEATDACPDVPAGPHPDPDRPGCPLPDSDGDSVPDAVDRCPDRVGAPSRDPERNGCPGLVVIRDGQIHILRPIFFETESAAILDGSVSVLEALADAMQAGNIQGLRIEGHTDDRGPAEHNLELSVQRAQAVRQWLIEHGIAPERVIAEGLGETRPLQSNETPEGRAANRRVEFHILDAAYQQRP